MLGWAPASGLRWELRAGFLGSTAGVLRDRAREARVGGGVKMILQGTLERGRSFSADPTRDKGCGLHNPASARHWPWGGA